MKRLHHILIILGFILLPTHSLAQDEEIAVAVGKFAPPFVMQTVNNQVYGFEIAMIQSLCKLMNKTCRLYSMHFKDSLNAVSQNQVDICVNSITITQERMQNMLFSIPYLHPQVSFMGLKTFTTQPFDISMLNNKRLGIQEGTVFPELLASLNLKNIQIKTYPYLQNVIDAIQNKDIDIAVLDSQSAWYWEAQTSGIMKTFGQPFEYGAGLGIAINPLQPALVPLINTAIEQYLKSPDFQKNVATYLYHF